MRVRRFLVVAGLGLLLTGTGQATADPEEPPEAPQPGQVTASATCSDGTAKITVALDFEFDQRPVRLDRVSPDQASLSKTTAEDPADPDVQTVVFEPVPVGQYLVHVDRRGDTPPADVPVLVKPCADLQPTDPPLRVQVECQAGWGIVTFIAANPKNQHVVEYTLTTGITKARAIHGLDQGLFLEITENGVEDRGYRARLKGDGVDFAVEYTVSCREGNAPRISVTASCPDTLTATVLNPNRVPVDYQVSVKGSTKKITLQGGEKGAVTFPGLAAGKEHQVLVTGSDKTQAQGSAKLDCGLATTTNPPTSTETPVPQGRSDSGLANTGTPVGALAGFGMLMFVFGGALFMIARRRVRRST